MMLKEKEYTLSHEAEKKLKDHLYWIKTSVNPTQLFKWPLYSKCN